MFSKTLTKSEHKQERKNREKLFYLRKEYEHAVSKLHHEKLLLRDIKDKDIWHNPSRDLAHYSIREIERVEREKINSTAKVAYRIKRVEMNISIVNELQVVINDNFKKEISQVSNYLGKDCMSIVSQYFT